MKIETIVKACSVLAALFLAAGISVGLAPTAGAATGILPASFGGWTASGAGAQWAPADLEKAAGDKAGVLREYGITSAEQGEYAQGAQKATLTIYRMVDPSAAFGAFTFLRDSQMTPLAAGEAAAYAAGGRGRALLVVGDLLLDVSSPARPANRDLKELADGLRPRASHAPYPDIAGMLPSIGLVANSERYVLGSQALAQAFPAGNANLHDWLGFDKSAEAIIAPYRLKGPSGDKKLLLLIALYPTQQVAADKYGDLGKWIALNTDVNPGDGRPQVFGKRSGSLVALVAGAESRQAATAFLDQIQYSSKVTWNEPTHTLTDPNIGTVVIGAIYGTGWIMLFAVVAGVGFGGIRIFTKFLFPGRVFDRKEQLEILQLGLSSKPIRAEDFYSSVGPSRES